MSQDDRKVVQAEDTIPTKELLRAQRKQQYAAQKSARKQTRLQEKSDKAKARAEQRAERDQELMSVLRNQSEKIRQEET